MSLPSWRSVILSVLSAVVLLIATVSPLSSTSSHNQGPALDKKRAAKERGWKRPASQHAEHPAWHTLSGAYYETRGRWSTKLTLNNKGRDASEPEVTLFDPQGRAFTLSHVVVPGAGFIELDLSGAVRRAGGSFGTGSIQVRYHGNNLQMGAQVLVQDLDRGLQFDEQLSYANSSYVNRLESLWWRPTDRARMAIVMTNLSGERIEVRAVADSGGHIDPSILAADRSGVSLTQTSGTTIFTNNGSPNYLDEVPSANQWHLRF